MLVPLWLTGDIAHVLAPGISAEEQLFCSDRGINYDSTFMCRKAFSGAFRPAVACLVSLGGLSPAPAGADPRGGLVPQCQRTARGPGSPPLDLPRDRRAGDLASVRKIIGRRAALPGRAGSGPGTGRSSNQTVPAGGPCGRARRRLEGTGDEPAAARPPWVARRRLTGVSLDFFTADPAGRAVSAAWLERVAPWQRSCSELREGAGAPALLLWRRWPSRVRGRGAQAGAGISAPVPSREQARARGMKLGFWLDERRSRAGDAGRGRAAQGLFSVGAAGRWPWSRFIWAGVLREPQRWRPPNLQVSRRPGRGSLWQRRHRGRAQRALGRPAPLFWPLAALTQLAARRDPGRARTTTGDGFAASRCPAA